MNNFANTKKNVVILLASKSGPHEKKEAKNFTLLSHKDGRNVAMFYWTAIKCGRMWVNVGGIFLSVGVIWINDFKVGLYVH
jgi:hypothetical protein